MSNSYIYIILYSLGWILTFVIYILKNKSYGIGGFILTVYVISSLSSIYFFSNTDEFISLELSFEPFLFLFICTLICILPILIYSKKISSIRIFIPDKNNYIYFFLLLSSPFIVEAFFEIMLIAIKTNSNQLGRIYESDFDTIGTQLSFFGRKTLAIVRWFQYLWPILFFFTLIAGEKYKKFSIICLLAFFSMLLEAYAGASRVGIVRSIFYFVIVYLLFKFSLPKEIVRLINILLIFIIASIIIFLSYITISRYNDITTNVDILTWVTLYTGEGELRFAQHVWELKQTTHGDTNFSLLKEMLGQHTFTDIQQRRDFYEIKIGIPTMIFYTFIGDWYLDLGFWGTILLSIAVFLVLQRVIKKGIRKGRYSLDSLLFISLITSVYIFGIMYYVFKSYMVQLLFVPTIILVIGYNLQQKFKR